MLFLSYSRDDQSAVRMLSTDLVQFGHEVWLDERTEGGAEWWEEVLEQIRSCDAFVFIASETSTRSRACRDELAYALALNRPVLPVAIRSDLDEVLPAELADVQAVTYTDGSKGEVANLVRAISDLREDRPLPDPLPTPPRLPVSSYTRLRDEVSADRLDADQQRAVIGRIRDLWEDEGDALRSRALLAELRQREDLLASLLQSVDALDGELSLDSGAAHRRLGLGGVALLNRAERTGVVMAGLSILALGLGQINSEVYSDCEGCALDWGEERSNVAVSRWPYVVIGVALLVCLVWWLSGRARRIGAVSFLAVAVVGVAALWLDVFQMTGDADEAIYRFGPGFAWTALGALLAQSAGIVLMMTSPIESANPQNRRL